MKFRDFLKLEGIQSQIAAKDKRDLIEKMVDILSSTNKLSFRGQILTAVLEREALMSTGVGKGVAIPHGKVDCINQVMGCLAIIKPSIDFGSPDGLPVEIVILLMASTKETGPHIRALAHISRVLQDEDVRLALLNAKTPKDILDVLEEKEKEV